MLEITDNFDAFMRQLGVAHRQVGFARTVALTRTARATAQEFLPNEARRVFDRPTRWTLNAFWWRAATADRSVFDIGVRSFGGSVPAAKYLAPQVHGGVRRQKRSEVALQRLMGNRSFWVPGPGVTLDVHGNVPGGTMRRILSDVQVAGDQSRTTRSRRRNKRYRQERYFVPSPASGLRPGVWVERPAGSRRIMPALIFVSAVGYRPRFGFYSRGMPYAEGRFQVELAQALREGWHLPRNVQKSLGLGGRV